MPDFNIRSDSVNVEQVMEQIRARIREKRGVDYTTEQIQELAQVKLEKFLDPRGVRSDLLGHFHSIQKPYEKPVFKRYTFEEDTLYETHRGVLRFIRRLLNPLLKLFFNPNPLIQALHIQAEWNQLAVQREVELENSRRDLEKMHYEMLHNLVLEITRLGIEVKNLKMRIESLTGRLDFNERRARALERAVSYEPPPEHTPSRSTQNQHRPPMAPPPLEHEQGVATAAASMAMPTVEGGPGASPEGPGQRSRRRRRRRGRRGGAPPAAAIMGAGTAPAPESQGPDAVTAPEPHGSYPDATERAASSRPVPSIEHAMVNDVHPIEPFGRPASSAPSSPAGSSSGDAPSSPDDDGSSQS